MAQLEAPFLTRLFPTHFYSISNRNCRRTCVMKLKNLLPKPKNPVAAVLGKKAYNAIMLEDDPLHKTCAPRPMRAAFAALDEYRAGIADFEQHIEGWQKEYDDFIQTGDPLDEDRVKIASSLKVRLEMAPNHLARVKADDKFAPLFDAIYSEVFAFERQLVEAGKAERQQWLNAIAPLVRHYCGSEETARAVVEGCSVFNGIPIARHATVFGTINEISIYWSLEHPSYTWSQLGNGLPTARRDAEEVLRERAAGLLAAYKLWHERGGRFASSEFSLPQQG
jgi:hypothetical protein